MEKPVLDKDIIERALSEDDTDNDVTTMPIVPPDHKSKAVIIARESGVIAGISFARAVFLRRPSDINFVALVDDGSFVDKNEAIVRLHGSTRILLSRERVALNFLQHCSGIATLTRRFVDKIAHTHACLLDTRKTTPGLRAIEKYAVRVGGGVNHRFSLSERVLIKDNHIAIAGGVTNAVNRIRESKNKDLPLEIEVKTLEQLHEALLCKP
ncbi:MAG: carboxylating nicotinate-nucleotide diphosphorylase, partial [Candidatus Ranarchaeia archaeon]